MDACGAVWVDEAEDREVCGTFTDEPYELADCEGSMAYVGVRLGRIRQGAVRLRWAWAGAVGCMVVAALAVAYVWGGHGYMR